MQEKALWDVDVEHTSISTATTQQLDLDGMDVLGEFGDQVLARKGGSTGDSGFSFPCFTWTRRGSKQRGAVVVDPKPPKRSNPLSDTCRRIGVKG
jgi:hypothetical protein